MFRAGDHVLIVAGPLKGREAVVVTLQGPDVVLDAEVFQRVARWCLPSAWLRPVNGEEA